MNSKNIVNKDVLLRKIQEYFSKNPKKTSAVFKSELGGKTFWKVQKEGKKFNITEVVTSKENFVFEAPAGSPNASTVVGRPKVNPRDIALRQQRLNKIGGKAGTASIARPSGPTPMDVDDQPKKDPNFAAKMAASDAETKRMLGWSVANLGDPSKDITKEFQKTNDIRQTIKAMPPDAFKRNFGALGVQNANQLLTNKNLWSKAMRQMSQVNPVFAKIAGRPAPAGSGPVPSSLSQKKGSLTAGKVNEASIPFSSISSAFMNYMSNPNDHVAASSFVNTISREKVKITDPKEKKSIEDIEREYLGAATKGVDASTRQTSISGVVPRKTTTVTAGKKVAGRVLREDEDKEKEKPEEEPKEKPEKEADPDVEAGVDTQNVGLDVEPQEPEAPAEPKKDEEQAAFTSRLSGQTIKNANIDLTGKGGSVTLELVGSKVPAQLSWEPSGKVVFMFKNRPYILRHG